MTYQSYTEQLMQIKLNYELGFIDRYERNDDILALKIKARRNGLAVSY